MPLATLATPDDFEGWRDSARSFARAGLPPEAVSWRIGEEAGDLFAAAEAATSALPPDRMLPDHKEPTADGPIFSVPRLFLDMAATTICHRDPERFGLLYLLLWRLRSAPKLVEDHADPLVRRIEAMAKEVRRDIHKMRAFLRFREVPGEDGASPRYVAWFEPDHHIVRTNARFFVDRFAAMRWSILTPDVSLHWDGERLEEGPGATRADAPDGDPLEETWKTYYASIFNPARIKIGAMMKEMPRKYWKNMPETALVPELVAGARAREVAMIEASRDALRSSSGQDDMGANVAGAWDALREDAMGCKRCSLWKPATQTVFGEGGTGATLMFVGEQPGDQEDLAGRPFVGPAGQMFDRALAEAGIDRATTYVTNAVKHFKYEQRGKRRIHSKPNGAEIEACRWWIEQERDLIRPPVTVALGATAARSLLGRVVTISGTRGAAHRLDDGGEAWVTVHPSYLLRIQDRAQADEEYRRFVDDLRQVGERVAALAG